MTKQASAHAEPIVQTLSELERVAVDLGKNSAPPPKQDQAPGVAGQSPAPGADEFDMSGFTMQDCTDLSRDCWGSAFVEIETELPWLQYPPEVKEKAVTRTAPVLYKYRDKLPKWFLAYREEIMLGMLLGGMIYGAYKAARVEAARREKLKNEKQPASGQQAKSETPSATAGPQPLS